LGYAAFLEDATLIYFAAFRYFFSLNKIVQDLYILSGFSFLWLLLVLIVPFTYCNLLYSYRGHGWDGDGGAVTSQMAMAPLAGAHQHLVARQYYLSM
jgi:hypothetical protein